jgi:glyoxylate carboligase
MAQNVADLMWKMLEKAGVKRCYGIIGDALNPEIDALHRNGNIEFVHVRHEEYGVSRLLPTHISPAIRLWCAVRRGRALPTCLTA